MLLMLKSTIILLDILTETFIITISHKKKFSLKGVAGR